jgi:NAD dependent epimerase/dehydratase
MPAIYRWLSDKGLYVLPDLAADVDPLSISNLPSGRTSTGPRFAGILLPRSIVQRAGISQVPLKAMTYKGKSILITGADGFIGSHLVEEVVAAGGKVDALAQYNAFGSNGWLDELDDSVLGETQVHHGDIRDPHYISKLVAGHDVVFHLAALIAVPYSYHAPQSYVDVNVTGTLNVLEACRTHEVERFVQTSTSEVYGTAQSTPISEDHPLQGQSPYAASKIAADMMVEAYVRSFELPAVILRPFNTYGPRQSERAIIPTIIRQALDPTCEVINVGDTSPKRDFNYVSDTVAAFLAIGACSQIEYGRPFNCGTGVTTSVTELIELIVGITGANKPIKVDAGRKRPKNSEVQLLLADANKFRAATEWAPQVSLEAGLEGAVDWWRGHLMNNGVRRSTTYLV